MRTVIRLRSMENFRQWLTGQMSTDDFRRSRGGVKVTEQHMEASEAGAMVGRPMTHTDEILGRIGIDSLMICDGYAPCGPCREGSPEECEGSAWYDEAVLRWMESTIAGEWAALANGPAPGEA